MVEALVNAVLKRFDCFRLTFGDELSTI